MALKRSEKKALRREVRAWLARSISSMANDPHTMFPGRTPEQLEVMGAEFASVASRIDPDTGDAAEPET